MLFPTAEFALFFLIILLVSWLGNDRREVWKTLMLLASYFFYGYWNWSLLGLIIGSTVFNHCIGVLVRPAATHPHRKKWLVVGMVGNLGVLGWFKYYNFFAASTRDLFQTFGVSVPLPHLDILLPVGVSFITFQAMSLVMDAYRGTLKEHPSLLDTAVFIAFFPQLVAGPILRAADFLPQIMRPSSREAIDIGRAALLILGGLFKKIVVANALSSMLVDPVFSEPEAYSGLLSWLAVYGYAVQIYCDFSAYSDIAIGVALLMGLRFNLNFDAPYLSSSLRDFWRRWHVSLSSWLRDYLYIPLGGSRGGDWLTSRNLVLTFLLGGLWHGAAWTFIVWGAVHGVWLTVERLWLRRYEATCSGPLWRLARGLITFHVVCFSWLFFRSQTFADAAAMLKGMFSAGNGEELPGAPVYVLLAIGFLMQFADGTRARRLWDGFNRLHWFAQGALASLAITLILALGPRGVAPFIYFQF